MLPLFSLEGRVALVTGAGKGIGRACVESLVAAGAEVIAVARTAGDLEQLRDRFGARVEPWVIDVRDADFLRRIEAMPALHILVNNAGTNAPMPFVDVDPETLAKLVSLNVTAAFQTAQAAVRVMLKAAQPHGVVINMSSQMGHVGSPNRTVYCMTKHAIEGLTKAMAVELAPQGIRVNAIAPTFIETPMTRPMFENPAFAAMVQNNIPLGRVGTVDDVTGALLYLVSDAARMVTGHSLVVDGGWTAQ
ncbi:3-oxoacyl-ACP reductase [Sphingomonas hengshuiensis]|uniref:3-oxoacyl-ACP reductase n=2 Tax=Sphingomonas hengshuiensis TaxID=1609977 RepID=A0A7U5CV65_9SPHN|nr:3-oxoacyl-ACP reductase [Sphingomonas hengshuiensis]